MEQQTVGLQQDYSRTSQRFCIFRIEDFSSRVGFRWEEGVTVTEAMHCSALELKTGWM